MKRLITLVALAVFLLPALADAQGVTTGTILGTVLDAQKQPVAGRDRRRHSPASGTTYEAATRADGRFAIPGMRVGGPYSVTVAHGGAGAAFQPQVAGERHGQPGHRHGPAVHREVRSVAEAVTVTAKSDPIFSSRAHGRRDGDQPRNARDAADDLRTPRIDVTRLTPQSGGNMSFAGQDNRLNNITVDGSYFNNSFGLRNAPGDTSGVAPISLAAIEQMQVNVAPFDVRQGNFVGAAVNTVTRSGSNQFRGSFYHQFRDDSLVGTEGQGPDGQPRHLQVPQYRRLGSAARSSRTRRSSSPTTRTRSFTQPGTTFRANPGGEAGRRQRDARARSPTSTS